MNSPRTYDPIEPRRVAFLGLGVMGHPMAGHLARAGHRVSVYNRTAAKADAWATEYGGRAAATPREAAAAASLGQVHRAVSHDGRRLACKLQYPDMASAVEADLQQLKFIFSIYRRYDKAIDPSNIHVELMARLREELDYRREARNTSLYGEMLRDEPRVHVPEPLPELSTDRLLTMTWLDGERMMKFIEAHRDDQEMRNRVAYNMFRAWYVPFYFYGIIHGDPHLGNYSVRPDGSVNLLDFGCIRVFPPDFVRGVIDLYRAIESDDEEEAARSLGTQLQGRWSLPTALAFLIWFVFAPQCLSTIAVMRRETNGWKWPSFALAYLFGLAYVAAGATFWGATALGL